MQEVKQTVNGTEMTFYPYSGYFVLGNDIRATVSVDKEHTYGAKTNGHNGYRSTNVDNMGFTGTFDGRGHTISGFMLKNGGLFGDLSNGAVIKNVAFTDIQLNGSQGDGGCAFHQKIKADQRVPGSQQRADQRRLWQCSHCKV